jgi:hypothetical protein
VKARAKYGEDFDRSGMYGFYASRGHFGFGIMVRNLLREEGCGEDYFEIGNLDDIYVQLLEGAAKSASLDILLKKAGRAA